MQNPTCDTCRWYTKDQNLHDLCSRQAFFAEKDYISWGRLPALPSRFWCSHHSAIQGGLTEKEKERLKQFVTHVPVRGYIEVTPDDEIKSVARKLGIDLEK